jgi:hypothetical protein
MESTAGFTNDPTKEQIVSTQLFELVERIVGLLFLPPDSEEADDRSDYWVKTVQVCCAIWKRIVQYQPIATAAGNVALFKTTIHSSESFLVITLKCGIDKKISYGSPAHISEHVRTSKGYLLKDKGSQ